VRRIVLLDGPAVLGWEHWRAIESRHGLGLIASALTHAIDDGTLIRTPVEPLAQLVLAMTIEAGLVIAHADDHDATRTRARQALRTLLSGLVNPARPTGLTQ